MNHFTEGLGLGRDTLYMQDYGGPVGFRMALTHPERIAALIVQEAVAHNEGLGANWNTRRTFWAARAANETALRTNLLSLATTRTRHAGNDPNVERYDPDLWTDEFAFLTQPGQADIQSDLFYDYHTNVDSYSKWQAWMREKQPRLLVIWGKYDLSFSLSEPEAYRGDVRTLKFTFLTPVISRWTRRPTRSPHWSRALPVLHVDGLSCFNHLSTKKGDFICDLTLFQALSSQTTSSPTKLRNAGSSQNCRDRIQWCSS